MDRDVYKDLTPKDQDKDLKYVLKEFLRKVKDDDKDHG